MKLKAYQARAMDEVRAYLEHLYERRAKLRDGDGYLADFAESAWEKCGVGRTYVKRKDGLGRPLPVFCLKVPTGGGKTLLAVKTIDLVQALYRRRSTGLVVWITPTLQIYRQTLQALRDRDHPYRQHLDQVSAGRTLIVEKGDRITPADTDENMVILMLMLPSASRANKEALRMFRDSGGFAEFFPPEEDWKAHAALLKANPKLDAFGEGGLPGTRLVKTSLGNVIRLQEALFIVDEGHRAYSEQAQSTLRDLNPCLIVELSATPPKEANKLVAISGRELLHEEMIKLDLHIVNKESTHWQDTLRAAMVRRDSLEELAVEHDGNTHQYIRPMCLIQVERTGRDQDDGRHIHANNVRDYLLGQGVPAEQIAAKTAEIDDLKDFDDVGGLLSRDCPVRYIITKQALQEGWDCPFAYVLAVLTHPQSKTAITQLIGRILRQPQARKTGIRDLDESYVYCFQRTRLLEEVRAGFMQEGLEDVSGRVASDVSEEEAARLVAARTRAKFRKEAGNLILPAFFIRDGEEWRLVSHEMDILSRLDWKRVDVSPLFDLPLDFTERRDVELAAGLNDELAELRKAESSATASAEIDLSYAAAHLLDTVPNPWVGYELVERVFAEIKARHPGREQVVNANLVHILERTRAHLEQERDRLAEEVFNGLLGSDRMRFMVMADHTPGRPPKTIPVRENARLLTRQSGAQIEMSLHERNDADDYNDLESEVASFLDEQSRLYFWYRNKPGAGGYFVQGWRPDRIFADFVFTSTGANTKAVRHVFVVETKGLHLRGSADTRYKESIFRLCTEQASRKDMAEFAPTMQGRSLRFEVLHQEEWKEKLLGLLQTGAD